MSRSKKGSNNSTMNESGLLKSPLQLVESIKRKASLSQSPSSKDPFDTGDPVLFKTFSQEFRDPALEQMYQSYISIALFQFHKTYLKTGFILSFLYAFYYYFFYPADQKSNPIRIVLSGFILFGMAGSGFASWCLMHFQRPRLWTVQKHALLVVIATTLWLAIGMIINDSLGVVVRLNTYQTRISQGIEDLIQINQRPFTVLMMPNQYYMLVSHIFLADLYSSLPTRVGIAAAIILTQLAIFMILIVPILYTTSGMLMTTALYMTCLCGAVLSASSNERFRRRNFYLAYSRLVKQKNTLTLQSGKAATVTTLLVKKTAMNEPSTVTVASPHSSIKTITFPVPNIDISRHESTTPNVQESLVQTIADVLQGNLEGYGHPIFWPLTQEMSSMERFLAHFCNPIATFFYRYFLLTSNDKELEARARERGALRAYKAGRSSFLILILSTLVGLINVQAQPLYGDYRFEATLRLSVVLSIYVIGFLYCLIGKDRLPKWLLYRSEYIIAATYTIAALAHLTTYFACATPANAASTKYFSDEVLAEFVVIYISMSTIVSLRFFSIQCVLMCAYTFGIYIWSPSFGINWFMSTLFMSPITMLMTAMSEKQRRLNLYERVTVSVTNKKSEKY